MNYQESKAHFINLAKQIQAQISLSQNFGTGKNKEDLFQTYALIPCKNPSNTMIILSGVHGVEGHLGTRMQLELMKQEKWLRKMRSENINVVFVHAVNPYGMSWQRRVNAENVDLNRNGLDFSTRSIAAPSPLQRKIFTPASHELQWTARLLRLALTHKRQAITQALAAGQYHFRQHIFYGGTSTQPELQELRRKITELVPAGSKIKIVDIHTGYGHFAKESFFNNLVESNPSQASLNYKAEGEIAQFLQRELKQHQLSYWTLEFGTYNPLTIAHALYSENHAWQRGHHGSSLLKYFFPQERQWPETVTRLGLERLKRIF